MSIIIKWLDSKAKRKDAKPMDTTSEKKSRGSGSNPMQHYSSFSVQGRRRRATRSLQKETDKGREVGEAAGEERCVQAVTVEDNREQPAESIQGLW